MLSLEGVAVQEGAHLEVLADRHVAEDGASFRDERDAEGSDLVCGAAARGCAEEVDLALAGDEPDDGLERGGFTRAVGADEGDDLALSDGERDAFDGLNTAVVDLEVCDAEGVGHDCLSVDSSTSAPR